MESVKKSPVHKQLNSRLIVLCCCGLSAGNVGVLINTAGVFYTPVSEALGILRGTFALQATFSLAATALAAPLVPALMEKLGLKKTLFIGMILTVGGTFLMSISRNIVLFCVLGLVRGTGSSLAGVIPATTVINAANIKRHGTVTSVVIAFSGVAGALFSPVLSLCITFFGWSASYIISAAMILVLVMPALFLLPDPNKQIKTAAAPRQKNAGRFAGGRLYTLCAFVVSMSLICGISSHLPGYAGARGMSPVIGSYLLSACMAGNLCSKIVIGFISDRSNPYRATALMMGVNVFALGLLLIAKSLLLIPAAFLYGSVYGIAAVGATLLTKEIFDNDEYPRVYAIIQFVVNMSVAVATAIVGYIYDFSGSYVIALVLALFLQLLGGLLLLKVRHANSAAEQKGGVLSMK